MKRSLALLGAFTATAAFTALGDLYMAGDSTMCNYNPRQYPQQGWGQALAEFMKNPDELHNWAIGGRSARSFKAEGRWQKIVDAIKIGDWVIIAFGHNDANRAKKERYSTPDEYKELMRGFAADVRAKGADVVFATSIPHSGGFSEANGVMNVRGGAAGIGPYVEATRELGAELGVPVLDLNKYACDKLPELGLEASYRLYMRIKAGEYKNCPGGKNDGCHTRDTGAFFFAKAAVELANAQELPIRALWKNPADVEHTPIPWGGPGGEVAPPKDDFSAEEIPYANEEGAAAEAAAASSKASTASAASKASRASRAKMEPWQREILDLRKEGERNGMSSEEAKTWAAGEYHRRHPKGK